MACLEVRSINMTIEECYSILQDINSPPDPIGVPLMSTGTLSPRFCTNDSYLGIISAGDLQEMGLQSSSYCPPRRPLARNSNCTIYGFGKVLAIPLPSRRKTPAHCTVRVRLDICCDWPSVMTRLVFMNAKLSCHVSPCHLGTLEPDER